MENRRGFLKKIALGASALALPAGALAVDDKTAAAAVAASPGGASLTGGYPTVTPRGLGLPITGTFLDEISYDIPHQNWGEAEWDADFRHMKSCGIKDVILIRCGLRKFTAYPSEYLMKKHNAYMPHVDLVDMFLRLAERHGMKFWFGTYDLGGLVPDKDISIMTEDNLHVIEEAWKRYGHYPAFGGWYLSCEISRATKGAIESFVKMGKLCKDLSGGLPTFISPFMDGKKAVLSSDNTLTKEDAVSVQEHEKEWNEIFDGIHEVVDACAFQDGHIDYDELDAFFEVNKKLADKYGIKCWTNAETFDRDMPIRFFPIKFEKLRMKLEAAKRAGYDKAITFEFSHFMSPQSAYLQACNLYNRYLEYMGIPRQA